jgi:hypothetical protein
MAKGWDSIFSIIIEGSNLVIADCLKILKYFFWILKASLGGTAFPTIL